MRARRREINIFNMSLLDILCGALGAFCFMMLVALPYYKPPGTAPDLRKAQAETEKLMRDLEQMKTQMRDQKSVAEMEELLRRLAAQVKALQGQVNILSAEKEELQRRAARLSADKERLQGEVNQLTAEKEQLRGQVNQLTAQNQQLNQENQELKRENAALKIRAPFLVAVYADGKQPLDLYLDAVRPGSAEGEKSPPFDPTRQWSHLYWPGDSEASLPSNGVSIWMVREAPAGSRFKLYVKVSPVDAIVSPRVSGLVIGADFAAISLPTVTLIPTRPWMLVGTLACPEPGKVIFTAATEGERDLEWKALSKGSPAGSTASPAPAP